MLPRLYKQGEYGEKNGGNARQYSKLADYDYSPAWI
jgi:hypothetical protein